MHADRNADSIDQIGPVLDTIVHGDPKRRPHRDCLTCYCPMIPGVKVRDDLLQRRIAIHAKGRFHFRWPIGRHLGIDQLDLACVHHFDQRLLKTAQRRANDLGILHFKDFTFELALTHLEQFPFWLVTHSTDHKSRGRVQAIHVDPDVFLSADNGIHLDLDFIETVRAKEINIHFHPLAVLLPFQQISPLTMVEPVREIFRL